VIYLIHKEKALPIVLVDADLPKHNLKNSWPGEAAWSLVGGSEGLSWTSCIEIDLHLKILTIFSNTIKQFKVASVLAPNVFLRFNLYLSFGNARCSCVTASLKEIEGR